MFAKWVKVLVISKHEKVSCRRVEYQLEWIFSERHSRKLDGLFRGEFLLGNLQDRRAHLNDMERYLPSLGKCQNLIEIFWFIAFTNRSFICHGWLTSNWPPQTAVFSSSSQYCFKSSMRYHSLKLSRPTLDLTIISSFYLPRVYMPPSSLYKKGMKSSGCPRM